MLELLAASLHLTVEQTRQVLRELTDDIARVKRER